MADARLFVTQAAAGAGPGRTSTVSTLTISSTGRPAASACRLIASGLEAC